MSLADLAATLWRERELLERLAYRLECQHLLVAGGRGRYLNQSTSEVETVHSELILVGLRRAALVDAVAADLGVERGAGLEELAAATEQPWAEVLREHRAAMVTLTGELTRLAEANRQLLATGLQAIEQTLAGLGVRRQPLGSPGYDSHGRREFLAGDAAVVVDRAL